MSYLLKPKLKHKENRPKIKLTNWDVNPICKGEVTATAQLIGTHI